MSDMYLKTSHNIKAKLGRRNIVRYDDGNIMLESAEKYGGRHAYNWEVVGVVVVLCSESAQRITGSLVSANGGLKGVQS
jgi:hypothetical protein